MNSFDVKPLIFVSKCLGFDKCRWNGDILSNSFVEKLKPFLQHIQQNLVQ